MINAVAVLTPAPRPTPKPSDVGVLGSRGVHVEVITKRPPAREPFRPATGTFALITPTGPLTPRAAKGVEFDTVVVADPERMTPAERYVALTHATWRLVVLRT